MPKFEMPKFEMPKFEVPAAFRELAEKGVAQAKENYEKVKSAAEQATDVLEDTYSTASKGCASYGLKLIETTRANSDATFDLMSELMTAKSYSEMVELSSAFLRKQFDTMIAQARNSASTRRRSRPKRPSRLRKASVLQQGRLTLFALTHRNSGCEARTEMSGLSFLGEGAPNGRLPKG